MNTTELTRPFIHSNGTSAHTLENDYGLARNALVDAIDSLDRCYPHGRDYYPLGGNALTKAQDEHRSRVERLRSVLDELRLLEEHCADVTARR
jgi:hypothetical protein